MGLGKVEVILLIVLILVVLFVGGKKLPELARGVGESARELKKVSAAKKKHQRKNHLKNRVVCGA